MGSKMADTLINPGVQVQAEPELRRTEDEPKGVIRKGMKPMIYLGAAALVITAAIFSSSGKKGPTQQASAGHQAPQPALQDNTDNNVQDLKSLAAERRREAEEAQQTSALTNATAAQQAAAAMYGQTGQTVPCAPGQACPQQVVAYGQQAGQLSPAQQEEQQLAAKERELAYNSRFASNLVYTPPRRKFCSATDARRPGRYIGHKLRTEWHLRPGQSTRQQLGRTRRPLEIRRPRQLAKTPISITRK